MYTTPGFTDERIHLFMATGLTRGVSTPEHDEFIEVIPLALSAALIMIERGEIQDAKTVVGLLFAAGFKGQR
jgi:ADP-ribose pyrophosphatase